MIFSRLSQTSVLEHLKICVFFLNLSLNWSVWNFGSQNSLKICLNRFKVFLLRLALMKWNKLHVVCVVDGAHQTVEHVSSG